MIEQYIPFYIASSVAPPSAALTREVPEDARRTCGAAEAGGGSPDPAGSPPAIRTVLPRSHRRRGPAASPPPRCGNDPVTLRPSCRRHGTLLSSSSDLGRPGVVGAQSRGKIGRPWNPDDLRFHQSRVRGSHCRHRGPPSIPKGLMIGGLGDAKQMPGRIRQEAVGKQRRQRRQEDRFRMLPGAGKKIRRRTGPSQSAPGTRHAPLAKRRARAAEWPANQGIWPSGFFK